MAQAARFEALEREAAKKKQGTRTDLEHSGNLPESKMGDTRDKLGAIVGMSGKTYETAKAVVEAAEKEPDKYSELVEQMDKTGKVAGAYRALRREKAHKEL